MRSRKPRAEPSSGNSSLQHQPFRRLGGLARTQRDTESPAPTPPPPLPAAPALSEDDLFQREMAGVRQLAAGAPARVPQPKPAPREIVNPDAEALAELSDLVAGAGPFDITDTTEYIEGAVVGLDPRLVRRLRAGEYVAQAHLDLHGLIAANARVAVDEFLARAFRRGYRCVLIIHGRGLNSPGQNPVLKKHLSTWLSRGAHARLVLAFTSARPCDGGAGAVYVLLRQHRTSKRPLRVTEGSKS